MQILHNCVRDGVTCSCRQLVIDAQHSLLIDCGLFQGAEIYADGKSDAERLAIDFDIDSVKVLIATHVHIDHVGRISQLQERASRDRSSAANPRHACCRWCCKLPSSSAAAATPVRWSAT